MLSYPRRTAPGEQVYHVLNRVNGRRPLFDHDGDYDAFERRANGS